MPSILTITSESFSEKEVSIDSIGKGQVVRGRTLSVCEFHQSAQPVSIQHEVVHIRREWVVTYVRDLTDMRHLEQIYV